MLPQYRLLALDIDGTLTNNEKVIPNDNLIALMEAQKAGIRIILASGRPPMGLRHLAEKLQLARYGGFLLSFNGGLVIEYATGTILKQETLTPAHYPYLYSCSHKHPSFRLVSYLDNCIACEDTDNHYVQYLADANRMQTKQLKSFLEEIQHPEHKCLMVGEPEPLQKLEQEMKIHLEGKMSLVRSEPFLLELLPLGIDKAKSLSLLLQHLQIPREELIACGDGFNDLSMIKYAGLGVAMANAQTPVKEAADLVTLSNDQCGVASIVRKFCLQKQE